MNYTYSLIEALNLDQCPSCLYKLIDENKQKKLIFRTEVERDSITHFECPKCGQLFMRKG
ncbi:MAG: hypothetical protein ACERKV_06755 [Clostridiaceae bacterium]